MSRRYRLALLAGAFGLFLSVGRSATGSFDFAVQQFWFASGAVLLIVLALVDQPHFSRDANIFVNGLTGLVSLLLVPLGWRDGLWLLFCSWSLYLVVSSSLLMWSRTLPLVAESPPVQIVSRINREIGRPEALFSAFLLWGAVRQFQVPSLALNAIFLFWAIFMILNLPAVASALESWMLRASMPTVQSAGIVASVASPNVAEIRLGLDAPRDIVGAAVTLVSGAGDLPCAEGVVIDDRVLVGHRIGRVAITAVQSSWSQVANHVARSVRVIFDSCPSPDTVPVGVVEPGSDIGGLVFSVHPAQVLRAGQVVSVAMDDKATTYFQLVSARIEELQSEQGNAIQRVRVDAGQLGRWDEARFRFEPLSWVAPAGALVRRYQQTAPLGAPPKGQVVVGSVPQSGFPIHANLEELVTHNAAILGVTGSGKTFLALHLIEAIVAQGIRVLILDVSRQHFGCLKDLGPTPLKEAADVPGWMASASLLGIHQFAGGKDGGLPQATAKFAQAAFSQLSKEDPTPGVDEPAKMCLVLEEAHSLIPEWNQVAQKGDEHAVNQTARIVLQGRKHGLGSLVITQRTANVTKTILNQCNTIFALQSFDQTGLDFLKNYLGDTYARAISTLPRLHGILVGRASSSVRPVIFAIDDMASRWVGKANGVDAQALPASRAETPPEACGEGTP